MSAPRRFDADVHVAVPSPQSLHPYLSQYWRDTLAYMRYRQPPSVASTYPPWSQALTTQGAELTLDAVRDDVLSVSNGALLQCFYGVESVQHPYLAPALARAVNEWLRDEWLDRDERLCASAVVAPHYPQAAVEEIERVAADERFVQILLPVRSLQGYGHQLYWPILEAAADRELPLALTYGGVSGTPPTPVNFLASFFEDYAAAGLAYQAQVSSLIFSGALDRFRSLEVVLVESGWTWLPSLCWRMDKEWKSSQREVPWLDGPPSGYVRRRFRATVQPTDAPPRPEHLRAVLDELHCDRLLLYASDYPHRQGDGLEALLAVLTTAETERLLWRNAEECYPRAAREVAA